MLGTRNGANIYFRRDKCIHVHACLRETSKFLHWTFSDMFLSAGMRCTFHSNDLRPVVHDLSGTIRLYRAINQWLRRGPSSQFLTSLVILSSQFFD